MGVHRSELRGSGGRREGGATSEGIGVRMKRDAPACNTDENNPCTPVDILPPTWRPSRRALSLDGALVSILHLQP